MVVAVWAGTDDQPLQLGWPPVAIDRSEEHLAELPARVDVGFGIPSRDDPVLLAVIIGVELEARIEVRMREERDRTEQRLGRQAACGGRVPGPFRAKRVASRLARARRRHVAVQAHPRLRLGGRALASQLLENDPHHAAHRAVKSGRVSRRQFVNRVGLHEGAAQRARIPDDSACDQVFQIGRGPMCDGDVRRRLSAQRCPVRKEGG